MFMLSSSKAELTLRKKALAYARTNPKPDENELSLCALLGLVPPT
jgi:hypothetical protein